MDFVMLSQIGFGTAVFGAIIAAIGIALSLFRNNSKLLEISPKIMIAGLIIIVLGFLVFLFSTSQNVPIHSLFL